MGFFGPDVGLDFCGDGVEEGGEGLVGIVGGVVGGVEGEVFKAVGEESDGGSQARDEFVFDSGIAGTGEVVCDVGRRVGGSGLENGERG